MFFYFFLSWVLEPVESCKKIGILILLTGCTVSPAQRIDNEAHKLGFVRQVIVGNKFNHVVYFNKVSQQSENLHVYLEGDGSPWLRKRFVSHDPTPRHPVMLRLMALDTNPSIYLGRPCYHGLATQPLCEPKFWTYGRYSLPVVDNMAAALQRVLDKGNYHSLAFFGFSGGGTLAMLLAERFPQTRSVVTIAGNLDPDAWVNYHDYSPLWTSLNPARRAPLNSRIQQIHLAGGRDQNIPPTIIRAAVSHQINAQIELISNFDHRCCWHRVWISVLTMLATKGR